MGGEGSIDIQLVDREDLSSEGTAGIAQIDPQSGDWQLATRLVQLILA
jgi:hypothetical protein